MSRFATTQCWKCHKYPTRILFILGKRAQKLSRKQHYPLTNPDVAGCCRMRSSRKTRCEALSGKQVQMHLRLRNMPANGKHGAKDHRPRRKHHAASFHRSLYLCRISAFLIQGSSTSLERICPGWYSFSSHSSYIKPLVIAIVMHTTPPTGRLYKSRHLVNIAA